MSIRTNNKRFFIFLVVLVLCLFCVSCNRSQTETSVESQSALAAVSMEKMTSCEGAVCFGEGKSSSVYCKDKCSNFFNEMQIISISKRLSNGGFAVAVKNNSAKDKESVAVFYKLTPNLEIQLVGPEIVKAKEKVTYLFKQASDTPDFKLKENPNNFRVVYGAE